MLTWDGGFRAKKELSPSGARRKASGIEGILP
jgi:hypothetical protein